MEFHGAFKDEGIFLAGTTDQFAEFVERADMQFRNDRDEALVEQIGRRIDVAIVFRLDCTAFARPRGTAPWARRA